MKLSLHQKIIFRTPKFSLDSNLEKCWNELKSSIAESSTEFYNLIKEITFEQINDLPTKTRYTIWKYFNRVKNRSTPFGTFAAIGICDIENERNNAPGITIDKTMREYRLQDWRNKEKVEYEFRDLKQGNASMFANSTYYPFQGNLRYISFSKGKFEIVELECDEFILAVLQYCTYPTPLETIIDKMKILCPDSREVEERIESLVDIQLLLTNLDANVTGEDYFTRIDFKDQFIDRQYIISIRESKNRNFPRHILRHVNDLVDLLVQYVPQSTNTRLQTFIQRFRKRFDAQEIPIMRALDPDIGIGYGDMEESVGIDDLIIKLVQNKVSDHDGSNHIKDYLSGFCSFKSAKLSGTIRLEHAKLGKARQNSLPLPNTFNLLFTEMDNNILIEHIGGVSATSLAGRFTLASDDIWNYTKDLVRIEQQANPAIIFFDIAYTAETEVDNVNRRRHIYDHQLSLFNYETSEHPITADDICISLQKDQLILRSKKLNKRLIPRLASAYNHSRSDLPVFRLLCDLQYQGIATNLQFRMEELFPGLDYYPRIQYHNIILSPEKWRVSDQHSIAVEQLKETLLQVGTAKRLRCGIGDQTLYFDVDKREDLEALFYFLKSKRTLLLEEAMVSDKTLIRDQSGAYYAAQFMATYTHNENIYGRLSEKTPVLNTVYDTRFFLPGSHWLYFEIYCHPSQMDYLLCGALNHFILSNAQYIKKWFFIRYDENGTHIRLRLKLYSINDNQQMIDILYHCLEKDYSSGLISDIKIRIYNRELERYGSDMIGEVEQHFCQSSRIVVNLLKKGITIEERYHWCISVAENLWNSEIKGIGDPVFFAGTILKSLLLEHQVTPDNFSAMNSSYKDYVCIFKNSASKFPVKRAVASFVKVINSCPEERRNTLFMDLFHMLVNRLFPFHQRVHEMLIYYYLDKMTKTKAYKVVNV